jgi:hypothetical protein
MYSIHIFLKSIYNLIIFPFHVLFQIYFFIKISKRQKKKVDEMEILIIKGRLLELNNTETIMVNNDP